MGKNSDSWTGVRIKDGPTQSNQAGNLRINDLSFYIPPNSIQFSEHSFNFTYPAMRGDDVLRIKTGRSLLKFSVSLIFSKVDVGETVYSQQQSFDQLAALLHQTSKYPFVLIENEFIRSKLSIDSGRTISAVVANTVLYPGSTMDMPQTIILNLQLVYFNYLPYTNNLLFNKKFNQKELYKYLIQLDNEGPDNFKKQYNGRSFSDLYAMASEVSMENPLIHDESSPLIHTSPSLVKDGGTVPRGWEAGGYVLGSESNVFNEYFYKSSRAQSFRNRKIKAPLKDEVIFDWHIYRIPEPAPTLPTAKINDIEANLEYLDLNVISTEGGVDARFHRNHIDDLHNIARQFKAKFGYCLPLNSVFRSYEKQANLHREHPQLAAAPGSSWHEVGGAVDVPLRYYLHKKGESEHKKVNGKHLKEPDASTFNLENVIQSLEGGILPETKDYELVKGNPKGITPVQWKYLRSIMKGKFKQLNCVKGIYGAAESWHFQVPVSRDSLTDTSYEFTDPTPKNLGFGAPLRQTDVDTTRTRQPTKNTPVTFDPNEISRLYNSLINNNTYEGIRSLLNINQTGGEADLLQKLKNLSFEERGLLYDNIHKTWSVEAMWDAREETGKTWDVITHKGEFILRRSEKISLNSGALPIVSLSLSTENGMSTIPLEGQQYPTCQFIGSSLKHGAIVFKASNDGHRAMLKRVVDMFHQMNEYALVARRLNNQLGIQIKNQLTTLMAIDYIMLDDIQSQTIDEEPGSELLTLTFSVTKRKQEHSYKFSYFATEEPINTELTKWFLDKIDITTIESMLINEDIAEAATPSLLGAGKSFIAARTLSEDLLESEKVLHFTVIPKPAFYGTVSSNAEITTRSLIKEFQNVLNSVFRTGVETQTAEDIHTYIDTDKTVENDKDTIQSWRAARDRFLRDYLIPFAYAANDSSLLNIVRKYNDVHDLVGTCAYPDLDLPPNPITGKQMDTNPDFLFYNKGRLGMYEDIEKAVDFSRDFLQKSSASLEKVIWEDWTPWIGLAPDQKPFPYEGMHATNPSYLNTESWKRKLPADRKRISAIRTVSTKAGETLRLEAKDSVRGTPVVSNKRTILPRPNTSLGKSIVKSSKNNWNEMKKYETISTIKNAEISDITPPNGMFELTHEFSTGTMLNLLDSKFKENFYFDKMTINRAFPAAKLYFIDDNKMMSSYGTDVYDDFYSVNGIKSLRIVMDRELPTRVAVIELLNPEGDFTYKNFRESDPDYNAYKQPYKNQDLAGQRSEQKGNHIIKEGTRVQIRLGYDNNPTNLETVFNGRIASFDGTQIVNIIAQSYGTQLVQKIYGPEYDNIFSWNDDTDEILSTMLAMPEVVNFGRWDFSDIGIRQKELNPDGSVKYRWQLVDSTVDDNIFALPRDKYWNFWWDMFLGGQGWLNFQLMHHTIWDIAKEMELRHPGWIASTVPFGDRETFFFGVPSMPYFYKSLPKPIFNKYVRSPVASKKDEAEIPKELLDEITKPFRDYHFVTSEHDIIQNNIRTDDRGCYNAVEVVYNDDANDMDNWFDGAMEAYRADGNTVTVKLDDSLPDELIKIKTVYEPNCNGENMARRYAIAHLWKEVKAHYKGSIIIIGNAKIKPYDVVFIYDSVNDMVGPIEVRRVIHTYSPETGFITEIYPDVCATVNEMATIHTMDAVYHGMGYLWGRLSARYQVGFSAASKGLTDTAAGTAAIGGAILAGAATSWLVGPLLTIALGGMGVWAGVKLVKFAMARHPIIITPLLKGGIPYVQGLGGREYKDVLTWREDKWEELKKDYSHGKQMATQATVEFLDAIFGR